MTRDLNGDKSQQWSARYFKKTASKSAEGFTWTLPIQVPLSKIFRMKNDCFGSKVSDFVGFFGIIGGINRSVPSVSLGCVARAPSVLPYLLRGTRWLALTGTGERLRCSGVPAGVWGSSATLFLLRTEKTTLDSRITSWRSTASTPSPDLQNPFSKSGNVATFCLSGVSNWIRIRRFFSFSKTCRSSFNIKSSLPFSVLDATILDFIDWNVSDGPLFLSAESRADINSANRRSFSSFWLWTTSSNALMALQISWKWVWSPRRLSMACASVNLYWSTADCSTLPPDGSLSGISTVSWLSVHFASASDAQVKHQDFSLKLDKIHFNSFNSKCD